MRKLIWNCCPTQEWESQSCTFEWSYQRELYVLLNLCHEYVNICCFPQLDHRGLLWLESDLGKTPQRCISSCVFSGMWSYLQKCTLRLVWVHWPSDELCEGSLTFSVLSSCSVPHRLSPADKAKLLQHHLLLMPHNLCRPDFVVSVISH